MWSVSVQSSRYMLYFVCTMLSKSAEAIGGLFPPGCMAAYRLYGMLIRPTCVQVNGDFRQATSMCSSHMIFLQPSGMLYIFADTCGS